MISNSPVWWYGTIPSRHQHLFILSINKTLCATRAWQLHIIAGNFCHWFDFCWLRHFLCHSSLRQCWNYVHWEDYIIESGKKSYTFAAVCVFFQPIIVILVINNLLFGLAYKWQWMLRDGGLSQTTNDNNNLTVFFVAWKQGRNIWGCVTPPQSDWQGKGHSCKAKDTLYGSSLSRSSIYVINVSEKIWFKNKFPAI